MVAVEPALRPFDRALDLSPRRRVRLGAHPPRDRATVTLEVRGRGAEAPGDVDGPEKVGDRMGVGVELPHAKEPVAARYACNPLEEPSRNRTAKQSRGQQRKPDA